MSGWADFEVSEEHRKELLREADRGRLVRELREGRASRTASRVEEIEVRWGLLEDETRVAELLELNGMPRWVAFEDRFIVAEKDGEILAAVRYRTEPKRLVLGLLVADPWAGERSLAVALYVGAGRLALELGATEVRAWADRYSDYPREAGYYRWRGDWRLDAPRFGGVRDELPAGGWRRRFALLGTLAVPFFGAFSARK
jgi:hypothetical protein